MHRRMNGCRRHPLVGVHDPDTIRTHAPAQIFPLAPAIHPAPAILPAPSQILPADPAIFSASHLTRQAKAQSLDVRAHHAASASKVVAAVSATADAAYAQSLLGLDDAA